MKRKTVVLLSSVLAGALLVGGTFAAFAVTDLASPKGADYTPGTTPEPEETTYVTLEWGQGSALTGIDKLENNELRKAGVVGLKSSTTYNGLFTVTISDATLPTVVKGEDDPRLLDHFNVYVYEGKDANPDTAELLGQLPDPAVQEDHQTQLKLYLGGQNTVNGHQVTVYVKISGLSDEDFAKVSQDVVHLEVDWAMNDKDGESYPYDNKVVYFAKPSDFGAKMYAHSWNATSTTTWPGTEMALDAATGLYKVDVPATHTNIIFNDGEKKLPTAEDDPTGQGYLFTGYDLTKGYVYWDSTSWQMLPVNADVNLFSLEKNGEAVPAATLAGYINNDPEVKGDNNVVYDIALAANDKLEFSYDGEPIYFCTSNDLGQDVLVDTEKTFDYAATYRFYINRFNHIFVQAQDEPVPPTPVIANNIIYGLQGSAEQWGKIADLVAHTEYEVKAEGVSLAAGDKFLFHLEGDSWMRYSNLKTEGEASAHAHFTSDDEDNLVVVTGGTFDFYVLKEGDKTIWSVVHGQEPEPEGEGFALYNVTETKQIVALTYAGKETGAKQRDQYNGQAELVKDQVITIRDLENAANFIADIEGYSFGGETPTSENWKEYLQVNEDGKSWTVLKDVNVNMYTKIAYEDNSVYFEVYTPIDPEALTELNLWVKFPITDAQAANPTFAWVFSNDTDGVWYPVSHIAETWETSGNRHYQFSMVNPVGKTMVLAVFSSDCGFDAEHLPTSWEKVVTQSGNTDINGASVDVYGQ